jgi:hypothetical protein
VAAFRWTEWQISVEYAVKLLQGAIIMSDAYTDDEPAKRGRDAGLWRSFDQTFAEARASFTDMPPDDLGANCKIGRCRDFPSRRNDKSGSEERVSPAKGW